jgi:hypothetical protein
MPEKVTGAANIEVGKGNDKRPSPGSAEPINPPPSVPLPPQPEPMGGKYEAELATFKTFGPNLRKDMGYVEDDDPRSVKNVPVDMATSWATDPRIDGGAHLSLMRGLGYRPVRTEEVTTGYADADKMVLRAYEVGPHDYVVAGGGVLLVGYRQYRDERRAAARAEALGRLDDNSNRLESVGVQQQARARSAPLSEVM